MADAVAGIIIGVVLALIIVAVLVLYCTGHLGTWRKRLSSTCVSEGKVPIVKAEQGSVRSQKSNTSSVKSGKSVKSSGGKSSGKSEKDDKKIVVKVERDDKVTTDKTEYAVPVFSSSSRQSSVGKGKVVYSQVGPSGGRTGPKPNITKSEYAKVNTQAQDNPTEYDLNSTVNGGKVQVYDDGGSTTDEDEGNADHIFV